MRKAISGWEIAAAALFVILTGGPLFLPAGLAFAYVLHQRREEAGKGELDDAKTY